MTYIVSGWALLYSLTHVKGIEALWTLYKHYNNSETMETTP